MSEPTPLDRNESDNDPAMDSSDASLNFDPESNSGYLDKSAGFLNESEESISLNDSATFGVGASAAVSPLTNPPVSRMTSTNARNQLMMGGAGITGKRGNARPGAGAASSSEALKKESERNKLIQSMRTVRGATANVPVRKYSIGGMRYSGEKRQIAGMLMLFGLGCIFEPMYLICDLAGTGGTWPRGTDFASMFGGACIMLLGVMAVGLGLAEFIVEFGNEKYTTAMLLWAVTGLIQMIASMTSVGRVAGSVGFVPKAYGPSALVNKFLGAMGIIAIAAYMFTMVGSVCSMGFSLYAFQVKKPHHRNREFYVARAALYGAALFLAGVAQLLTGIFIIGVYGMHLGAGPIQVGFFLINIPAITALVGLLQAVAGLWGFVRSFGLFMNGRTDNRFQVVLGAVWVAQLLLQCVAQSAYLPNGEGAGLASTVAGLTIGLHFMPFYLDFKVRTTLKRLKPGYFGLVEDEEMPDNDEDDDKMTPERARNATNGVKTSSRALPQALEPP